MERVKLISTTVLLTVLIWTGADSLVNEAVTVTVTFDLLPGAGASTMILGRSAPDESFDLQLSGPRRLVEAVQGLAPLKIRLRVPDRRTGADTVRLDRAMLKQELIELREEFRRLTIVSVDPEAVPVQVDHWTERPVALVLRRVTLACDVEPQLNPNSITVRLRESVADQLPSAQPLQIDMAPEVERLLRESTPGQSVTLTMPVPLDDRVFGPNAEARPAGVEVTATVQAQRSTAQIPTVPILVALSFTTLERPCRAVARDGSRLSLVTQTITVTGPTDEVAKLVRGTTRVYGVIHLKQEDMEPLDVVKLMTPEYRLPPGVKLAEQPPPIEFKLVPLGEAGPEP